MTTQTKSQPMQENEIVLYQPNETTRIEVRLENETVWLTQQQMADLFERTPQNITMHISNAYKEGELDKTSTCKESLQVQIEGTRRVVRKVKYYDLDVIISVGYRVKSKRGTAFRIWARNVLKDYLVKGYSINQRFERLEQRVSHTEEKIDFFVRTSLPPVEGVFFDGQIYDAYELVCKLVKSAQKRIILIDNYIDESVLTLLDKRSKGVKAEIYTQHPDAQLRLDIKRHNSQYPAIPVHTLAQSHDRFLLIDNDVYHVGASIKDLGKRWFAIMKMQETKADQILSHILPTGGGKIDSKSDYFTAKTISLLRRFVSYAAGLFFALLLFASCQDGQFPKIGTYENSEGEYYHFCTGNNFHCKISEIDHLLSGTYELLGDSTILLTFFDEDGKATGEEIALRFSQCASDSFYIEPVGGSPMHKKKYVRLE